MLLAEAQLSSELPRLTAAALVLRLSPKRRAVCLCGGAQLSTSFVEAACERCPLLESLALDQCDMVDRGMHITQAPYSPLQQVVVSACS